MPPTARRRLPIDIVAESKGSGFKDADKQLGSLDKTALSTSQRIGNLGESMQNVGASMTRSVTLPLVAIGAAAVKTAIDFDGAMSKIVGLVGVGRDEIGEMREGVLELAGETTKSPQELADALFTITSAGARGAEAMDILEASAKASAAGLGETRSIAEAVTASVNTYGSDVLDAAEATDILVGTARAGNFETSQFAGALGNVLPFAKQANVSLDDLGGTVALLTRSNNDANSSLTQASSLFRKLAFPAATAQDQLRQVGLNADMVTESVGEDGLVATLQMLDESFEGNRAAMAAFLGDSEAQAAAFAILDASGQDVSDTFGAVADSAGLTDNAFAAFAESAGFESKQAMANLQVALVELGDTLVPIANEVIGFASDLLKAFSDLPGPVRKALVAFAGFAAALGPLMSVGGRILTIYASMSKLFANTGSALARLAVPADTVSGAFRGAGSEADAMSGKLGRVQRVAAVAGGIAGVAGLVLAVKSMADARREAQLDELAEQLASVTNTSDEAAVAAIGVAAEFGNAGAASERLNGLWERTLEMGTAQAERFLEMAEAAGVNEEQLDEWSAALGRKQRADAQAAIDQEANTRAVQEGTEAVETAIDAAQRYVDALTAQFDPVFGLLDAEQRSRESRVRLREAQENLTQATREHGPASDEAEQAERDLESARRDARGAVLDLESAGIRLRGELAEENIDLAETRDSLVRMARAQGFTAEEARDLADDILGVRQKADILTSGSPYDADVEVNDHATGMLDLIRDQANRLDGRQVNVRVVASLRQQMGVFADILNFGGGRQHGGPVRAGEAVIVGEQQPELFVPEQDGTILPEVPDLFRGLNGISVVAGGELDRFTEAVTMAISDSTRRQIDADTVHFHWLAGQFDREIENLSSHQKERHTDLRQNLWFLLRGQAIPNMFNVTRFALGLPQFADGGIVPGRLGEPQLVMAHGGEEIIPSDGMRSGGVMVNVHRGAFDGAIISSSRDAQRWIANALAEGVRKGVIRASDLR